MTEPKVLSLQEQNQLLEPSAQSQAYAKAKINGLEVRVAQHERHLDDDSLTYLPRVTTTAY